jgi:hypothetical protein
LDLLHATSLEEMARRGRLPPTDQTTNRSSRTDKSLPKRQVGAATVSLTRGQVNAVLAAFKAGIKPSLIARQFGQVDHLGSALLRRSFSRVSSKSFGEGNHVGLRCFLSGS